MICVHALPRLPGGTACGVLVAPRPEKVSFCYVLSSELV